MATTHDPYLNTFYYYSGRRLADTDRDQQIEDNTTKALINTLNAEASQIPAVRKSMASASTCQREMADFWGLFMSAEVNRFTVRAQLFSSASACMVDLDAVGQEDVDYLLRKMATLKQKEEGRGFFEIQIQREFPRDSKVLRSGEFVAIVTEDMKKLAVVDQFLSGS